MRTITKNIPSKSFADNSAVKQSYRVIGTIDINGKGTPHAIAAVDPFIFLDETCMKGDEPWPFPKHPHSGLVAMTYMLAVLLLRIQNMKLLSLFSCVDCLTTKLSIK